MSGAGKCELRFAYGARGKPSLASPACDWPSFNLSHSGDLAVVALADGCEIGIDVERMREDVDIDALGSRLTACAPAGAQPAARRRAFFTYWSRREAC